MDLLITNVLLESIFNFEKGTNGKYANMAICVFSVGPLPNMHNMRHMHNMHNMHNMHSMHNINNMNKMQNMHIVYNIAQSTTLFA